MKHAWSYIVGKDRRLVLRFMVHVSGNAWFDAEDRLIDAEIAHEKATKRLARCLRNVNATRAAYFRWKHRLEKDKGVTVGAGGDVP